MSNLNDDLLDDGLQGGMGKERCQNPEDWQKAAAYKKKASVVPAEKKAMDGRWEPVKVNHTEMEKIKACAKDALLHGGLASVFFYFQMSDQMSITASMICIVACVLVGGIKIGKHSVEG